MKIVLRDGICEIWFCRVNQPCVFLEICMAVFGNYGLKIMNIGQLLSLRKKIRYIKKTSRYMIQYKQGSIVFQKIWNTVLFLQKSYRKFEKEKKNGNYRITNLRQFKCIQ